MEQLFKIFNTVRQAKRISAILFNYVPQRGVRYETKITWNEPEKYRHYHPLRTGDTAALTITNPDKIHSKFRNSKELDSADEKVKKIFSLGYQKRKNVLEHYNCELVEKVKEHALDNKSRGVIIAKLTARIRHLQNVINIRPSRAAHCRSKIHTLTGKRKAQLNKLRSEDYKKFEWILEVLDLQFQPGLANECRKISRKTSLILLARLKAEKVKEEKLAALKKTYDDQKPQFLEKKLTTLKQIKEMEEKFSLPPSVSDEDIQMCIDKLEKVRIKVAENARVGYQRKIHPYFLEPYYENWLKEKEKRGQIIRQEMEQCGRNKPSQDTPS